METPEDERVDFVKVLDFGIAKVVDPLTGTAEGLTSSSQVMGTAMYMAPEQAMGREVDARTDVYALGVVAFEMLAGRKPFSGLTAFEVLMRRVNEPPPRIRDFEPQVALEVESLLLRAMAREPAARFQDMRELEAAILAIPDDAAESVTVRPSDPTGPELPAGDAATATSARFKAAPAAMFAPGPRRTLLYQGEATTEPPASPVSTVPSLAPVPATTQSGPSDPVMTPVQPSRAWVGIVALVLVLVAVVGGGAWVALGEPDETIVADAAPQPSPMSESKTTKPKSDPEPLARLPEPPPAKPDVDVAAPPPVQTPPAENADPVPEPTPAPEKPAPRKKKPRAPAKKVKPPAATPAPPKPPVKKTDADALAALRAKAKKKCAAGDTEGAVKLRFVLDGTRAGFVRDRGSSAGAAAVACVSGLVKSASFPTGGSRTKTLTVTF